MRVNLSVPSSFGRAIHWPGRVVVGLAILVVLWFVTTFTLGSVLAKTNPDAALRWDPNNGAALERAAVQGVADPTAVDTPRVVDLARRALARSPLSGDATAALATAIAVRQPSRDVAPLFAYSRSVSRRVALTQMWYIERAVEKGDVPRALQSYDRLFRTSDVARGALMPILQGASAEPAVARSVATLLETRPPWRDEYFNGLITVPPGPDNLVLLTRAMHMRATDPDDAARLTTVMKRLVDMGRAELAFNVLRSVQPLASVADGVRNGDFEHPIGLAPFDWELTQNDELSAVLGPVSSGTALMLTGSGSHDKSFAQQLVLLAPGRYRLSFAAGDASPAASDRPSVTLRCAVPKETTDLVRLPVAASVAPRRVAAAFAVPTGCRAQWLRIIPGLSDDDAEQRPWIDDLRVERTP